MPSLLPFKPNGPLAAIARRFAWSVPIVGGLGLVGSALEGVGIGLLIPLLTTLLGGDSGSATTGFAFLDELVGGYAPRTRLLIICAAIFTLIVLKNAVFAVSRVFVAWIDGRASHEIRRALGHQLLWVGYPFHLQHDAARLVNIVSSEAWRASDAIRALFAMVAGTASVAVFAALLLAVDWRLSIAVAVGTLLIRLLHVRLLKRLRVVSVRISRANQALADRMLTSVLAMRLIRVFGQERREEKRFDAASDVVRREMFALERASARVSPVQEVLQTALFIAILLGATLSGAGVAVPVLVTFLVLLQRVQPHLRAVEQARIGLAGAQGPVAEVEWLLDPADKPPPPTGRRPHDGVRSEIAFRNVEFRYATRHGAGAAVQSASFDIRAGVSTALIGHSGSGKSTIVNLLCRLLEPTAGRILVDGIDLAEIDVVDWRGRIAIAGQDIDLVEGTIADNIAYGVPGLTTSETEAAARAADAHQFIAALPEGYNTKVGSRGLSLSGGQRQRIGLARAIARGPDLLILDEATNSVDGVSETAILELLRRSRGQMTLLVISHRASTLACCDDGVVIDDGQIIEAGPLDGLDTWRRMVATSV